MRRLLLIALAATILSTGCDGSPFDGSHSRVTDTPPEEETWFDAYLPVVDGQGSVMPFATILYCDSSIDPSVTGTLGSCEPVLGDPETWEGEGMLSTIRLSYRIAEGARSAVSDTREVHLHLGGEGDDGPIVAVLFDAESAGPPLTCSASDAEDIDVGCQERAGRITLLARPGGEERGTYHGFLMATDLMGPLAGWTIGDVLDALRSGDPKLYVDLHTVDDPQGTRRGQLTHPKNPWD